jgi:hypothetical protein
MATQTELIKSNQPDHPLFHTQQARLDDVFVAFLTLAVFSAVVWFYFEGEELVESQRALEVISARYQGQADVYARNTVDSLKALGVISSRYQSMADLHVAGEKAAAQRALTIISIRYQGLADAYAENNAGAARALTFISARYQGMTDLYTSGIRNESLRKLAIISARYQAQAERYKVFGGTGPNPWLIHSPPCFLEIFPKPNIHLHIIVNGGAYISTVRSSRIYVVTHSPIR